MSEFLAKEFKIPTVKISPKENFDLMVLDKCYRYNSYMQVTSIDMVYNIRENRIAKGKLAV